jgi:hypothetical protein
MAVKITYLLPDDIPDGVLPKFAIRAKQHAGEAKGRVGRLLG